MFGYSWRRDGHGEISHLAGCLGHTCSCASIERTQGLCIRDVWTQEGDFIRHDTRQCVLDGPHTQHLTPDGETWEWPPDDVDKYKILTAQLAQFYDAVAEQANRGHVA